MKYKSGYKYQLVEPYRHRLPATFEVTRHYDDGLYLSLDLAGVLSIRAGYAWDGPSGPTIDTRNFMRPSLVHDALYQLMREGHLPQSARAAADDLLYDLCVADGMSRLRAWVVYRAVRLFAGPAARGDHRRPILEAP